MGSIELGGSKFETEIQPQVQRLQMYKFEGSAKRVEEGKRDRSRALAIPENCCIAAALEKFPGAKIGTGIKPEIAF